MSPSEFTFKIEMDNNTKEAMESIDYDGVLHVEELNNLSLEALEAPGIFTMLDDPLLFKWDSIYEDPKIVITCYELNESIEDKEVIILCDRYFPDWRVKE